MTILGGFGYGGTALQTPNVRDTQQYTYDVITPPANLAVELATVKTHLKIPVTDVEDDAYLTLLINSSTDFFQKYTNRILINTGFRTFFDCFRQSFELVRSKLQTLDAFEYSQDGTFVAVDPSIYYNTVENNYSRIIISNITNFPTDKDDQYQSIRVDFTAGYGLVSTNVPPDIRIALLNQIAALYENRGDCDTCDCSDIGMLPTATQYVYNQYRIMSAYGSHYRG